MPVGTLLGVAGRVAGRINRLGRRRVCTMCGWKGFRFGPYGNEKIARGDAACPACGSLERHRLAYALLRDRLGRDHRTLHVAPEAQVAKWLESISRDYLSIDLAGPAMRRMDLTSLDLPDESMTLIWCSHVLEHIPDDARAMREMHRVLRPGGIAVIQVPIMRESTYEDPSITTPQGRLEAFMQVDHVRLYGLDLADRLRTAGFDAQVLTPAGLDRGRVKKERLSLWLTDHVFLAKKPRG